MISTLIKTVTIFLDLMIGCMIGVTALTIISAIAYIKNKKGDKNERENDTDKSD